MGDPFFRVFSYLNHSLKAKNEHALHSPFLFSWYKEVIKNKGNKVGPVFPESLRKRFLSDNSQIQGQDHGTGGDQKRTVSNYASKSLGSGKQLKILNRMISFLKPKSVVELGTCLGVSTFYFQDAIKYPVISVEGNRGLFLKALEVGSNSEGIKPDFRLGTFLDLLPQILNEIKNPWFIYLDGDHSYDGTKKYFELIVEKARQDCILVLDDIYWSKGMAKAWSEIKADERVPLSLDFFHFGVLIFRYNQPKQHFILKT